MSLGRAARPGSSGGADSKLPERQEGTKDNPLPRGAATLHGNEKGNSWETARLPHPGVSLGALLLSGALGEGRQGGWAQGTSSLAVAAFPVSVTESQGHWGWKTPPRPLSPLCDQSQPCQPEHSDGAFHSRWFPFLPSRCFFHRIGGGIRSIPVGTEGSGRGMIVGAASVMGPIEWDGCDPGWRLSGEVMQVGEEKRGHVNNIIQPVCCEQAECESGPNLSLSGTPADPFLHGSAARKVNLLMQRLRD